MEIILNNYLHEDKACLASTADLFLAPTRFVLGYQTIQIGERDEDVKCQNIALRILLAPVALLLLPVTFIACVVKWLSGEVQKVHALYQRGMSENQLTSEKVFSYIQKANPNLLQKDSFNLDQHQLVVLQEYLEEFDKACTLFFQDISKPFRNEYFAISEDKSIDGAGSINFQLDVEYVEAEDIFRLKRGGAVSPISDIKVLQALLSGYLFETRSKELIANAPNGASFSLPDFTKTKQLVDLIKFSPRPVNVSMLTSDDLRILNQFLKEFSNAWINFICGPKKMVEIDIFRFEKVKPHVIQFNWKLKNTYNLKTAGVQLGNDFLPIVKEELLDILTGHLFMSFGDEVIAVSSEYGGAMPEGYSIPHRFLYLEGYDRDPFTEEYMDFPRNPIYLPGGKQVIRDANGLHPKAEVAVQSPSSLSKETVCKWIKDSRILIDYSSVLTPEVLKGLSTLLLEVSSGFEAFLKETPINTWFTFERKAPHVLTWNLVPSRIKLDYFGINPDLHIGKIRVPLQPRALMAILFGHLSTAFPMVLGFKETRSGNDPVEAGLFVYLEGFQNDPFDAEHIVYDNNFHPTESVVFITVKGGESGCKDRNGYQLALPSYML